MQKQMTMIKLFAIVALNLLGAVGGFQLGSRISEVKTSLMFSLDDFASLIAVKKDLDSEMSMRAYEKLKTRYIWRYEGVEKTYEKSKYKWLIELDGDINLGFKALEKRKEEL